MKDFDSDDVISPIEIENDSGMNLLRFSNFLIVESKIDGVGLFVEMNLHGILLALRSKNAVTTDQGLTASL